MAKGSRSSYERGVDRTLADLLGNKGGKINPLDGADYGGMLAAEGQLRGLDRERALIYRNISESPEAAYQGDRGSVSFVPPWDPQTATLTHNHPDKRHGGTFSYADINTATTSEFASTRAASREGTYYLKPRKGAQPTALNRRLAKDVPKLERKMRRESDKIKKRRDKGEITWGQAERMQRTVVTGVLHKYYKTVAPEYGYVYGRQKTNQSYR